MKKNTKRDLITAFIIFVLSLIAFTIGLYFSNKVTLDATDGFLIGVLFYFSISVAPIFFALVIALAVRGSKEIKAKEQELIAAEQKRIANNLEQRRQNHQKEMANYRTSIENAENSIQLSNTIEELNKKITLINQQLSDTNKSMRDKAATLVRLENQRAELQKYRNTLGSFKGKERKQIDTKRLPSFDYDILNCNIELDKLKIYSETLTQQKEKVNDKIAKIIQEKEKRERKETLMKSAQQGDSKAKYELAIIYQKEGNAESSILMKELVENGYPEAIEFVYNAKKEAAKKGNSQAQYELALIYQKEGNLEGLTWMEKAARNGHPEAIKFLKEMAVKRFNKEKEKAEQGDANAQFSLGTYYEQGFEFAEYGIIKVSPKEAVKWYFMAIEQNHPYAMFSLAVLFHNGADGVEKDGESALKLYELAIDNGLSGNELGIAKRSRDALEKKKRMLEEIKKMIK